MRPTSPTFLTVWPTGAARPNASSINAGLDQTVANLVIAQIGTNGKISIFNERGNTDVLVDVVGYIADGAAYVPLNPVRVMDTRTGFGTYGLLQPSLALSKQLGRLGPNQTFTLDLDNQLTSSLDGSSLSSVAGFVFNVTAVDATAPSYLTVSPGGLPRPNASNINVTTGSIVITASATGLSGTATASTVAGTGAATFTNLAVSGASGTPVTITFSSGTLATTTADVTPTAGGATIRVSLPECIAAIPPVKLR